MSPNNESKVVTSVDTGDDYGNAIAIQSDGKILQAGATHNGTDWDWAIVRFEADGDLDGGAAQAWASRGVALSLSDRNREAVAAAATSSSRRHTTERREGPSPDGADSSEASGSSSSSWQTSASWASRTSAKAPSSKASA